MRSQTEISNAPIADQLNVPTSKITPGKKYCTAEEAVQLVKSGDRVFLHGSAATPVHLIKALQKRYAEV